MTIEQQCADAMARITKNINQAAGQHKRAIRSAFNKAGNDAGEAVSVWSGPTAITRKVVQLSRNSKALRIAGAQVIHGNTQGQSLSLANAVNGIQKHVESDGDCVVGLVHVDPCKLGSVAA